MLILKYRSVFTQSFCSDPRLHKRSYQTNPSKNKKNGICLNFSFLVRPPQINILHSYRKGLCILTSWQKIGIADCSGLEYQINYIYENSTVQTFLVNMTTDNHSYCVSNLRTAVNIFQVEIRGILRKNLGASSIKNVSFNSTVANVTERPTTVLTFVAGKLLRILLALLL